MCVSHPHRSITTVEHQRGDMIQSPAFSRRCKDQCHRRQRTCPAPTQSFAQLIRSRLFWKPLPGEPAEQSSHPHSSSFNEEIRRKATDQTTTLTGYDIASKARSTSGLRILNPNGVTLVAMVANPRPKLDRHAATPKDQHHPVGVRRIVLVAKVPQVGTHGDPMLPRRGFPTGG